VSVSVILYHIMRNEPVKVGVIGVGHLGQHHAKHYKKLSGTNIVGIFDADIKRSKKISERYNIPFYDSLIKLLKEVDAVSIVTPTKFHSVVAKICIENGKHIFIEKPITKTLKEADELLELAKQKKVLIQVGHIERLNPALLALKTYNIAPTFIELQRLAPYTSRGTDVPVVLDKMIHDIDILLSLVNNPVRTIQAKGLSILTDSVDIAHARIRFEDGTVASIMSSRIAKDEVRKIKLFQPQLYATIDLLACLTEVYKVIGNKEGGEMSDLVVPFEYNKKMQYIAYEKPAIEKVDLLKLELKNFILSIKNKEKPIVSGKDGRDALKVALEIQNQITQDIN